MKTDINWVSVLVQFIIPVITVLANTVLAIVIGRSKYIRDRNDKKTDELSLAVATVQSDMAEHKFNYLDRFNDMHSNLHKLEMSLTKELQDVKAILLNDRDKINNLIIEHNYIHKHLAKGHDNA